jgi:hypothetical protein
MQRDVHYSGDIILLHRDTAELFPAHPNTELIPGSVMVIGPTAC